MFGGGGFNPARANLALFKGMYPSVSSPAIVAQAWIKPKNASFLYLLSIGAGGGGGVGSVGGLGTAAGGGAGGIPSSMAELIIPAALVPPVLYVYVPQGGVGSTGGNGQSGLPSYIQSVPGTQTGAQCVLASGAAGTSATVGNDAAGAAGGSSSTGNVAPTAVDFVLGSLGRWTGWGGGGNGGGGGGAVGSPSPRADTGSGAVRTSILTGGAGGGGTSSANAEFAGGAITIGNPGTIIGPTTLPGGAGGGTGAVYDGSNGLSLMSLIIGDKPWIFTGGAGGAGTGNVTGAPSSGGRGGKGAIGCGGGGGGGAIQTRTAGAGGDGGDGLVAIWWW